MSARFISKVLVFRILIKPLSGQMRWQNGAGCWQELGDTRKSQPGKQVDLSSTCEAAAYSGMSWKSHVTCLLCPFSGHGMG